MDGKSWGYLGKSFLTWNHVYVKRDIVFEQKSIFVCVCVHGTEEKK